MTPVPTRTPPPPAPTRTTSFELSLDARLAATDAAMTLALEEAAVAYEVRTAHIPTTPLDLAAVITVPLAPVPQPPPDPHPTPVAALLQRAHHRLLTGGWCGGALVDERGARCLYGAIRAEAHGDRALESGGLDVLMDAITREFGEGIDSVPGFNDAWGDGRVPTRTLDRAVRLADARGL
ncbi:hypothetical protein ACIP88_31035 [Streptomyces uncialis]|uniref:DUF6197 family protein n=1 Tax=Streptomyces uncialis TaxID=1048205 RepID=UPI0037FEDFEF